MNEFHWIGLQVIVEKHDGFRTEMLAEDIQHAAVIQVAVFEIALVILHIKKFLEGSLEAILYKAAVLGSNVLIMATEDDDGRGIGKMGRKQLYFIFQLLVELPREQDTVAAAFLHHLRIALEMVPLDILDSLEKWENAVLKVCRACFARTYMIINLLFPCLRHEQCGCRILNREIKQQPTAMKAIQCQNSLSLAMAMTDHYRKLESMYLGARVNQFHYPSTKVEIGEGTATIHLTLGPDYHHALGGVHGSIYFKLLDDAAFFAASSLVQDVFVLTQSFQLSFLRPISEGKVKSTGKVRVASANIIIAESTLWNEQGKEIAFGSGNFMRSKAPLSEEIGYK